MMSLRQRNRQCLVSVVIVPQAVAEAVLRLQSTSAMARDSLNRSRQAMTTSSNAASVTSAVELAKSDSLRISS